jgi:IS5 family transposase
MTKLDNTSETAIAITFLVMNLSTWLRRVFGVFLCRTGKTTPVFGVNIISNYTWRKLTQERLS